MDGTTMILQSTLLLGLLLTFCNGGSHIPRKHESTLEAPPVHPTEGKPFSTGERHVPERKPSKPPISLLDFRGRPVLDGTGYSVVLQTQCANETHISFQYKGSNDTNYMECPPKERFCDPDRRVCTSRRPLPPYKCPGADDIFPLVDSCEGFVMCQNRTAQMFQCKPGQRYSHNQRMCLDNKRLRRQPCHLFKCNGRHGKMVVHQADPRLYTLCKEGDPISMNECPAGFLFNDERQDCVIVCRGEGFLQDHLIKGKYYYCVVDNKKYRDFWVICPEGMIFDFTGKHCVTAEPKDSNASSPVVVEPPEGGIVVPTDDLDYGLY